MAMAGVAALAAVLFASPAVALQSLAPRRMPRHVLVPRLAGAESLEGAPALDAEDDVSTKTPQSIDLKPPTEEGSIVASVQKAWTPGPPKILTPRVVTFDATGTLMQLTEPVGMHYREALLQASGLRLPSPDHFDAAFKEVYKAQSEEFPCFGCGAAMPSRDWWYPVVRDTYLKTGVPEKILDPLLPEIFDSLYDNVFAGSEGWELNEQAIYVLDTLIELKESRAEDDPLYLGVISNFDERLHKLLDNLGIAHYFDIVLTSKECCVEKPNSPIFDMALSRLGIYDRSQAVHIGDTFDKDVVGAARAGWNAIFVRAPPYRMNNLGDLPCDIEFQRVGDLSHVLDIFNLADFERPVIMTAARGIFEEDAEGDAEEDAS